MGPFRTAGGSGGPGAGRSEVRVHDFPDPHRARRSPTGSTTWPQHRLGERGQDHDTAASRSSRSAAGGTRAEADYPGGRLLITADGGGSNGYRVRLWKVELAALARGKRAGHHGVPPPARDQQVEQDRASAVLLHHHELARPPAGQPRGHREQIGATTTRTGLKVTPTSTPAATPPATKVSDGADGHSHRLARHPFHGDWNYTLPPVPRPAAAGTARPARARPGCRRPRRPRGPRRGRAGQPRAGTASPRRGPRRLAAGLELPWPPPRAAAATWTAATPAAPAPRRPPSSTPSEAQLQATIYHHRPGMPSTRIAAPPGVRHEAHQPLHPATSAACSARPATPSSPPRPPLATLDDLYRHATTAGITIPAKIKPAC